MEQLKLILIGIIIGGSSMYWFKNDSKPTTSPVKIIEKECLEEVKTVPLSHTEFKDTEKEESDKIENKSKRKETMKTPDELYEEQQEMTIESEITEIDRTVIPLELEQAESETQQSVEETIDSTIVPIELQEVESQVTSEIEKLETENSVPLSEPEEINEEEIETKEAVSDELRDKEEYGEEEILSDEDTKLPK